MSATTTRWVLALVLALPVACADDGGDNENDLDERQAQTSWAAANHAAAPAHADFATHVVLGERGDVSLACDDGGVLHMSGVMTDTYDFDLEVTYDDCIEDGVMINGDISIVAAVDVAVDDEDEQYDGAAHDEGIEASVVIDYAGRIELDGDVEGTCVIDARITSHAALFEYFRSAELIVEGTVCGHDADDVIHA